MPGNGPQDNPNYQDTGKTSAKAQNKPRPATPSNYNFGFTAPSPAASFAAPAQQDSYGVGGGGSAAFGDSAVPALASSPAYQAYLRELGLSEADATNDEQFREAMLRRQLEPGSANLAQLDQQGTLQRQQISGGMESRGIFHSGEHEQALALQRASEGAQRSALQGQINDQIALLQHNLAQQLAGIAKTRAEGTLSSAGGIYGQ